MKRIFLSFLLFSLSLTGFAQNNLRSDFKLPGGVPNLLNVCGAPDTAIFVIRTEGISAQQRTNILSTLKLFKGIEMVAFLTNLSSSGVVLTNNSNPNAPQFSLPNLGPSGISSVEIAVLLAADCNYMDSIMLNGQADVNNAFTHTYNLGGQSLQEVDITSEYRTALKAPNLSIAIQSNQPPPAKVGQCFSRNFTIANAALEGFTDTVVYQNRQGAGVSVKQIYIEGVPIPFTKTVQGIDTIITARIAGSYLQSARLGSGPGDGDIYFDPNESLTLREDYCLTSCTQSRLSRHSVGWGCKGKLCVTNNVDGFVQIGQGQPNALITHAPNDPANKSTGYCKPGAIRVVYRNTGVSIDPGFGDMVDLEVLIGLTNQYLIQHPYITTTAITLAGVSVPVSNTISIKNNPLFATDPDGPGGLEDLDGDGFYDDLATNRSFSLLVNFEFNCANAQRPGPDSLCLNEVNLVWNTQLQYKDPCGLTISKSLGNFGSMQSTNEEFTNCIDTDAYPNQKFSVQHIQTRGVRNFDKNCNNQERFVVWAKLPPGVTAIGSDFQLFKNNSSIEVPRLNSYQSNDTIFVEFDAKNPFLNGKYDIRALFTPDCTVPIGRIRIPFGFQVYCPGCDCRHDWYCENLEGPQFHPTVPPCTVGISCPAGLQTTDFDVQRTTFGFTDQSYTNRVTASQANTNVAIQCDSVRMIVSNIVGQTPITDSIGVIIAYDNVEFRRDTNQIFLFDKGTLRINRGGTIHNCPVDKSMLRVTAGDTSKVLRFDFSSCLSGLGITLQPGDSVNFYGNFLMNPKGAMIDNFRKVPNFRAFGFSVENGDTLSCDNFGENFFVCKIPTVVAIPGGPDFPKGCANTPFAYRLITKNVGFSDYYINEYYPAVKVDSLVLEYDTTLLSTFSNFEVKVSIPGHPVHGNNFYTIHKLTSADKGRYVAKFDTLVQFPSYNIVQSYSFNLQVSVAPGCESLTGSSNNNSLYKLNPTFYFSDNYFAKWFGDGSCSPDTAISRTQNLTYSEPPTLSFEPVTNPSVYLSKDTVEWVVKQCNTSTKSDALLTWLSTEFDTTMLRLVSVELIDNPAMPEVLPIRYFGTGKSFVYTPGVFRQASNNSATAVCNFLRIRAIPKKCGTTHVRLNMGWNCSAYDDPNWTPDDYAPCVADTMGLSVTTLDAEVESTIIGQPPIFPSVCDTVSLDLLVRNNGEGRLFNVNSIFSIPLQAGNYIPGSAQIAWPSDAPYQNAIGDPVFIGSTIKGRYYSFNGFSQLHANLAQNGLEGFDPNNPTTRNEFKIRYSFVAGCDFRGGAQIFYQFSGFQSCGEPTNIDAGESFPIYFSGLVPPDDKNFDAKINLSSVLQSGSNSTLELEVTNLRNTLSDNQDKVSIKLPAGISYMPGSSVPVRPAGWLPGNPVVTIASGISILTWTLPTGMMLNDTATLRFDVTSPQLSCNAQLEVAISTVRDTSIICYNGNQTCGASVITSGGEKYFTLGVGSNASFAGGDKTICAPGQIQLGQQDPNFVNYSWQPAHLLDNANIATPTANVTASTTFIVTATDAQGCIKVDTVHVRVINQLNIQMQAQNATCGLSNGSILVNVTNGSGNYQYNWIPTSLSGNQPSGLAQGTYTVAVTDLTSNCTGTSQVQVGTSGVAVTATNMTTAQITSGPLGTIFIMISQGTAPYTISWSGPNSHVGSQSNIAGPNYTISGLVAGAYQVEIIDATGCILRLNTTVPLITTSNLMVSASSLPDTSCCSGAGVASILVQGGISPYQLVLTPSAGVTQTLPNGGFVITGLDAGNYTVSVTDANGATASTTLVVADACQCAGIFDDEVIYDVSGVESLCLPIPFIDINNYPLVVNGQPYTGPFQGCDFDTVVYYAFSFLNGAGFNGPYKLQSWVCNNVTISNVAFKDLYALADSMNKWDPNGNWLLDETNSVIYGGDIDQVIYGQMKTMHMPTWTPYVSQVNYTDFAYGTEIFVNPFDSKYVITAYDSSTCCSDTLCIILLNPCEQLIPQEPYVVTAQQPSICLPLPYQSIHEYYVFFDGQRRFQFSSCNNGNGSLVSVPPNLGVHQMIVIDTVARCADTVLVEVINATNLDVIPITTLVNTGVSLCGDTTELLGTDISTSICGTQQYGTLSLQNLLCWVYQPNLNFIGIDTVCINACDEYGYCDSTIFVITVIPPPTSPDTLFFTTNVGQIITPICADTTELIGAFSGITICQQPGNGTLSMLPSTCLTYTPNAGFVGVDMACILSCDTYGICDTTYIAISVMPPSPTPDTLRLNTFVNIGIPNICPVLSQIGGVAQTINYCGTALHGTTTINGFCVNYQPNFNYVGNDTFCIYVCSPSGICDTTQVYINIEPNGGLTTDTVTVITQVNTRSQWFCVDLSELGGGNPASFDLCGSPTHGIATLNAPCYYYTPAPNYVGTDQFCLITCNVAGACDTTIVNVIVQPLGPNLPTTDTLYLTTFVNTPTATNCVDLTEIGGSASSFNLCGLLTNGQVSVATPCFVYTPNTGFVGTDVFCLVACNQASICDTTYVIVTVQPNVPPPGPTKDTLYITTLVNTPSANTCVNLSQIGGTALSFTMCANPANGSATLNNPCFIYLPNTGFVGNDQFCVVACNAAGVCDTTIVLVTVQPNVPPPGPTTDTIQITTFVNTPTTTNCVNLSQIGGTAVSFTLCGNSASGTVNLSNTCFIYVPFAGFIGNDKFCVVACNAAGVCDTTIVLVTVQPNLPPPGPTIDTIQITTFVDTPSANTCVNLSQIGGTAATFTLCANPANGSATISNSCFIYLPNTGFVGNDQFCVVACNAAGICDTTIVLVTVIPNLPPGPTVDTIRITTPYQTVTPSICLPTTQLSGPPTALTICDQPANGVLVQLNATCIMYSPNSNFIGNDTICAVLCSNAVCDTTIIIVTVLPPSDPDCMIFNPDSISVEVFNGAPFAQVCLPLRLDSVPAFDWYLDGSLYTGSFIGCDFDSCVDYTYFTIPDFGDNGPYLLNYWQLNGQNITTIFQNVEDLVDSMNVWDPQGDWFINQPTLSILSCTQTNNIYGDIKVTQLATGSIGLLELNLNLIPHGTSVQIPPGPHQLVINGDDGCTDTLFINVQPSSKIEIDTFTYLNTGPDTLCLTDYGVSATGLTSIMNLCPQSSGTDITYTLDTASLCIIYTGIDLGEDSICFKLAYGADSCAYVNIRVTVLEPLPCIDFIAATSANGSLNTCDGSDTVMICVDLPYALLSEFIFTANGQPMPTVECPPNAQGIPQIGVVFDTAGMYNLVFTRTMMNCSDSVSVVITCPGSQLILYDTIYLGQSDSLCLDTTGLGASPFTLTNVCPSNSGTSVLFTVPLSGVCIGYEGLLVGTETACVQICNATGQCDTVLVQVTVLPDTGALLPPIAVFDVDTVKAGTQGIIPILQNDTLNGTLTQIYILTLPLHGDAVIVNNQLIYLADTSKCRYTDSLEYVICNAAGCDTAWVYIYVPCTKFKIYNGFSPNGDMVNDFFHIDGLELFPNHELKIYNRWGARVYETRSYQNDWNGTWNGKLLPGGVYFYIFDDGERNIYSGSLTIIR